MYSIISSVTEFVANRVHATYILLNAISIKGTFCIFYCHVWKYSLNQGAFYADI